MIFQSRNCVNKDVLIASHGFAVVDEIEYFVCDFMGKVVQFGISHEGEIIFLGKTASTE
jgi:hypothetical protein